MIGLKSFQAQIILFLFLTINEVIRAKEKSFRKPKPNLSNFFMQLEDMVLLMYSTQPDLRLHAVMSVMMYIVEKHY